MKVTAEPLPTAPPVAEKRGSVMSIAMDLTKARLTGLVLVTSLVGYYVGSYGSVDLVPMLNMLLGTAVLASGASALNQFIEREYDALMWRTCGRPLPAGLLRPETVLVMGGTASVAGMLYLALTVNLITALLGAMTLVSYVFIYTPLKRVTPFNTVVGAIPGALPPLMGWTAARGEVTVEGWSLFAILFFWQLPHFFAIAWLYRDEYAKAGFMMLPVVDPQGERTGRYAISHTLGLLPISLAPFLFKLAGVVYLASALVLSLGFLWCAIHFARRLSVASARRLFYASIIYLPLLLGLMVLDKVK